MTISGLTQLYNMALNATGARDNISSPTENSREAEVCQIWYSPVRDQVLAAAAWPEATEINYLALLEEREDDTWAYGNPKPGYTYVYDLPSDYLRANYLTDFSKFLVSGYEGEKNALHSNTQQAVLAYTKRLETISLWGPELQMAIVYGLAANICMPLSGKPSRAKTLVDKANEIILAARVTAANASNEQYEHVPDWIAARGYNFGSSEAYFYPYGSMLNVH